MHTVALVSNPWVINMHGRILNEQDIWTLAEMTRSLATYSWSANDKSMTYRSEGSTCIKSMTNVG